MAKSGSRLTWTTTWRPWCANRGALPGSTALGAPAPPESSLRCTTPGGRPPARPRATPAGTRALIEVLLLHRHMPREHVVAGLATRGDRIDASGNPSDEAVRRKRHLHEKTAATKQ
jgi:hypothetical protein